MHINANSQTASCEDSGIMYVIIEQTALWKLRPIRLRTETILSQDELWGL